MGINRVEVSIGGNTYSLQGTESPEHIREVAAMIDQKIIAIKEKAFSNSLSSAHINILAAIQLASDYLKLKEETDLYKEAFETYSLENEELKREIEHLRKKEKRG